MKKLSYKHGNKHTSSVSQGITNMWTASGMQCVNDPQTMAGAWTWPAHASDTMYTHSWGPPSAPAEIPGSWLNKCVNTFCSESQRVYEYVSVIFSVFAFCETIYLWDVCSPKFRRGTYNTMHFLFVMQMNLSHNHCSYHFLFEGKPRCVICAVYHQGFQPGPSGNCSNADCYGSNASVSNKPALKPRKVTVPSGGLWEVNRSGASSPHDGVSALIKGPQRAPLAPPPRRDTGNRRPSRQLAPTRHQMCRHHDLGLLSVRMRETSVCCVQVPPSVAFCHGGLSGRGRWPQQQRSSGRQSWATRFVSIKTEVTSRVC